jgi:hypothetical protein
MANLNNLVKFVSCTAAQYAAAEKNDATIYFVTDTLQLYKGSNAYGGGKVISVTSLPTSDATPGAIYVSSKGEVSFAASASTLTPIVVPATEIVEDGTGFTTSAQVYDFVTEAVGGVDLSQVATNKTNIESLQSAVDTLNGTSDGSVKKIAEDAAASAVSQLVDGADQSFDTLKEISDWLLSEDAGAGKITADIAANAKAIEDLQSQVGTGDVSAQITSALDELDFTQVGEDGKYISAITQEDGKITSATLTALPDYSDTYDAKGAADAVKTAVVGSTTDTSAADTIYGAKQKALDLDAAMDTRVKDLESAVGENGSVSTQISNAINALDVDDSAVDKQYVSSVSETDGKITVSRTTLPVYSVGESTEQGNILVNGANVKVAGLGSAAYKAASDFDASGAADTALASAKAYADDKVSSVKAADKSITIGGSDTEPTVGVALSAADGNVLKLKEDGLAVEVPAATDYTVAVAKTNPEGVSTRYIISQEATGLSANIDIPLDMVVSAGAVEIKEEAGDWGAAGTYLVLTLANANKDKVYINVGSLIEYVTSGSSADDQIQVSIDADHKVTATLAKAVEKSQLATDVQASLEKADTALQKVAEGSITTAELSEGVNASLTKADSALQASNITTGATSGTIAVNGEDVAVKGLGSAAYTSTDAYATAAQGEKADSALQASDITDGTTNGKITVGSKEVAVAGLGSAAYTDSTAYASASDFEKVVEALTWQTLS